MVCMVEMEATAASLGVEIREMSPDSPVEVFVLGRVVLYKPTGDDVEDAHRIGRGLTLFRSSWTPPPGSAVFLRRET
jgi:hypothetical protein